MIHNATKLMSLTEKVDSALEKNFRENLKEPGLTSFLASIKKMKYEDFHTNVHRKMINLIIIIVNLN